MEAEKDVSRGDGIMIYIEKEREFQITEPTVVTIGKFDGRQIGRAHV